MLDLEGQTRKGEFVNPFLVFGEPFRFPIKSSIDRAFSLEGLDNPWIPADPTL